MPKYSKLKEAIFIKLGSKKVVFNLMFNFHLQDFREGNVKDICPQPSLLLPTTEGGEEAAKNCFRMDEEPSPKVPQESGVIRSRFCLAAEPPIYLQKNSIIGKVSTAGNAAWQALQRT